jgi:hypothetical protein
MHHHEARNNPQHFASAKMCPTHLPAAIRAVQLYLTFGPVVIVSFCLLRPELCNRTEFNDLQPAHVEKMVLQLVHDGFTSSEAALSAAPPPPQQLQLTALLLQLCPPRRSAHRNSLADQECRPCCGALLAGAHVEEQARAVFFNRKDRGSQTELEIMRVSILLSISHCPLFGI